MSKLWVGILAGAGGVLVGLWIAKQYARNQTQDLVHTALDAVGLAGGTVEKTADAFILPQVG